MTQAIFMGEYKELLELTALWQFICFKRPQNLKSVLESMKYGIALAPLPYPALSPPSSDLSMQGIGKAGSHPRLWSGKKIWDEDIQGALTNSPPEDISLKEVSKWNIPLPLYFCTLNSVP